MLSPADFVEAEVSVAVVALHSGEAEQHFGAHQWGIEATGCDLPLPGVLPPFTAVRRTDL
jgi:hypothetical protein